jgi:hypothetical protein
MIRVSAAATVASENCSSFVSGDSSLFGITLATTALLCCSRVLYWRVSTLEERPSHLLRLRVMDLTRKTITARQKIALATIITASTAPEGRQPPAEMTPNRAKSPTSAYSHRLEETST